jgi:choice-of-anchor C domain-containing protein
MKKIQLAIMAATLALPCAVFANLVQDGGFEAPVVTGSYTEYTASATMGGWQVTSGSVDLIGTYWSAPERLQSLDLSGLQRGTISQTISLSAGTYKLTFSMSGNHDGPPELKTVDVSLGGPSQQFNSMLSAAANQWETKTGFFMVSSTGQYDLKFKDISQESTAYIPAYGAAIDNIQLTAVPEPTTVIAGAMLLLPFGVSTLRILRKNRAA